VNRLQQNLAQFTKPNTGSFKKVDNCGYELPTNFLNFMEKDLTKVKVFQKVLGGHFFETPCISTRASVQSHEMQRFVSFLFVFVYETRLHDKTIDGFSRAIAQRM